MPPGAFDASPFSTGRSVLILEPEPPVLYPLSLLHRWTVLSLLAMGDAPPLLLPDSSTGL